MSALDDVKGSQRVAALLLSLPPKERAVLLGKLREDVLESVAGAMIELDPRLTQSGVIDALKNDLARLVHSDRVVRSCDAKDLHQLLTEGLGQERGATVLQEINERRLRERPFLDIEGFDPFDVGRVLRDESNAVAALVLAHLDPVASAKILSVFDEAVAVDVVRRIAVLEPPSADVLRSIAAHLAQRVAQAPSTPGTADPSARLKSVSNVLKESPPALEKGVIAAMAEEDEDMARELREFMFTWDDIATIDTRTMQKILGTVDTKTLSIALKGCSEEIAANVFANLSARVSEMVQEERELLGALPKSDVEGARSDIMTNIRALIEAGEFRPARGGDDLVE